MELFAAAEPRPPPRPLPLHLLLSAPAAANPPPSSASPPMEDVVAALEHAFMSAKRLSFSAASAMGVDASEVSSAIASLRNAHRVIGSFLDPPLPVPPPVDGAGDGDEPMGDDGAVAVGEAGVADASSGVGEVEEGFAECGSGMQSKRRRKRPVPAFWPAGRTGDREVAAADPVDRRRSAMDIVFQFHG